jgi:hypothetical protein
VTREGIKLIKIAMCDGWHPLMAASFLFTSLAMDGILCLHISSLSLSLSLSPPPPLSSLSLFPINLVTLENTKNKSLIYVILDIRQSLIRR